jgi:two-component system, response regulator / RNA-binding antiterminator
LHEEVAIVLEPSRRAIVGGSRLPLPHCALPREKQYAGMESRSLAILVIDENRIRASIIEAGLRETGHDNVTVVYDIVGVARTIAETNPDVIVISLENPNRDVLENMFQLSRAVRRPIAMFVDRSDRASIEAAVEAGVSAYVVDGLKQERVKPILDMAISRFNAFSRLSRELEEARNELENRKLVERAKGILMKSRGLSEEDAYALLRKTAMNQNRKLADIAQSLVTAAGLLGPEEEP